jgi:hypothetical protein
VRKYILFLDVGIKIQLVLLRTVATKAYSGILADFTMITSID